MTDKYTDLLARMIEIPSPSGEEGKVADMLEAFLRDSSLPVKRKGNNLWLDSDDIRPSGGKGTILLNAHIDTVRPAEGWKRSPYEARIEDGKLYGLGSNDDGASVVALLRAWEILCSKPQPCRLVWSATAEEENGGPEGLEMILPEIGKPDLGIFGEPTGMRMAIAERGLLVLDCISHAFLVIIHGCRVDAPIAYRYSIFNHPLGFPLRDVIDTKPYHRHFHSIIQLFVFHNIFLSVC